MLITLLKGIVIGITISAPLGPVGILCLRETLHGSRREGLLTGLGAMLSDVLYGFVVYLGVSLVLDFVVRYDALLRLVGGLVIVAFAILLYRKAQKGIKSTPTKRLSKLHGVRKVLTAFLVTAANPFIMLLMLPLYTRFHFVQTEGISWYLFVALLGLAIGCMLWWSILTYVVRLIAERTGHAGIRVISRVIALVLGLLGLIGIYSGTASLVTGKHHASEQLIHLRSFEVEPESNHSPTHGINPQ